jgi:hypothetical protein
MMRAPAIRPAPRIRLHNAPVLRALSPRERAGMLADQVIILRRDPADVAAEILQAEINAAADQLLRWLGWASWAVIAAMAALVLPKVLAGLLA